MRVAYDISVLGSGVLDPKARTGVFRVVENLGRALTEREDCEISFCAGGRTFHPLYGALRYLKSSPEFASVPFLSGGARARAHSLLLDRLLEEESTPTGGPTGLIARARNSLRGRSVSLIANRGFPLSEDRLRGLDVFHSPYHALPAWKDPPLRKRFLTIYDLIALKRPDLYEPHVEAHDRAILDSIGPDDFVTCISEATRSELCDYTGIDPERTFVTPLAASGELFKPCGDREAVERALHRYGVPNEPYLLALGTLKPGKNIGTTIRVFAELVAGGHVGELNLVLVGTAGWDYASVYDAARDAGEVRDRIHFTGFVADDDLAPLYSGALAFVFPSLYEGFGLPALEAMQCGVPVVAADTSAVPEVVGDGGILVDPMDVDGFCDALLALYRDPVHRSDLSARALARAGTFSWARCAADTAAAYRTALSA